MLVVENICKTYETKTILKNISFTITRNERAALFGVNGSGKTTLFRILCGEEKADSGSFHFSPLGLSRYYLPQTRSFRPDETVESVLQLVKIDQKHTEKQIEKISAALSTDPDNESLQEKFDQLLNQIQVNDSNCDEVHRLLHEFGLGRYPLNTPVSILSGGQRTRLALAAALSSRAEFLLLDEPTNDLDEEMLHDLEERLCAFRGAVLFVSHDRFFLDQCATKIMEIDRNSHTLKVYEGNYTFWRERKAAEREAAMAAWTRQQDEIARLKKSEERIREITNFRKGGKADTNDKFAKGFFANRSLESVKRATKAKSRIEKLQGEDRISKPGSQWKMKMNSGDLSETGAIVFACSDLCIGYENHMIQHDLNFTIKSGQICALTGPNGCGKSTLIKTIIGEIQPLSGKFRLGTGVNFAYLPQGSRPDFIHGTALESIQSICGLNETEARRVLSFYLFFGDDSFIPVENLSNGQIARLSLAGFSVEEKNFLVLDEPLNHLDIESREQFEEALRNFPGSALVVAHDRFFVAGTADQEWRLNGNL